MKRALITGITGQDGSYLAEQLLAKGYEVHGVIRRSSSFNTERIDSIYRDRHEQNVKLLLHHGDLTESSRLVRLVYEIQPDEVYHLGAQSHVRVSFDVPEYTSDVTGMGTVRLLEAIRDAGVQPRFYQASSSEMFGSTPPPHSETTPFHPRSPYAVAKLAAFWITVNYRESYGMFATNGILFNHECVSASTPLMVRERGVAAVRTPVDLVPLLRKGPSVQQFTPGDRDMLQVWDGEEWTFVTAITATRRRRTDPEHRLLSVQARAGVVDVTAHHHMLDADWQQVAAGELEAGDRLAVAECMPPSEESGGVTTEVAELLGYLAGDGSVSLPSIDTWLREQLYTRTGHKQVPPVVLNGDDEARDSFLRGFRAAGGLEDSEDRAIETTNPVLAQGLYWLLDLAGEGPSLSLLQRRGAVSYQVNLRSALPVGATGLHADDDPAEVRRIVESVGVDDEWVFDIETESGVFCAGVGRIVVHNSPRRGETFVTRKVTRALARIHLGLQDKLFMGNLDAKRDWGYAPDYTDAMWRILQADEPEDFVIATGEMHSVRDFLDEAAAHLGLDWEKHVEVDERYFRPAEVAALCGDASKARERLGWEPTVRFKELVRIMVDADVKAVEDQLDGKGVRID